MAGRKGRKLAALLVAYARVHRTGKPPAARRHLRAFEAAVIAEAREWRLDWHPSGGRLTALELLAALQHYGVPTRMIDFTYNPLIALWFAVEEPDDIDGRVFAIETRRLVSRESAALATPWREAIPPRVTTEWTTESWIWRPPPFDARMVRQKGCFLLGGVPSTQPARNVWTAQSGWRLLRAEEVRRCMSVPFQLINYDQAEAAAEGRRLAGAPPRQTRAFTLRITNKAELRENLGQMFGYSYASLFPDFSGLADYGRSWL